MDDSYSAGLALLERPTPLERWKPAQTVKQADAWEAFCCMPGCRYGHSHDRRAGDLTDPTGDAAGHVADTGHHVTVTRTVQIITEIAPAVTA